MEYRLSFIDSYRLMPDKLLDLVDNLSGIHDKECKNCMKGKRKFIEFSLIVWYDSLRYECKECGNKSSKQLNGAIKKFPILYQFCKGDLNKFFLLRGKGYYPYEDADSWEKFDKTTISPKEAFYSQLNLEGIRDVGYAHVQKVWEVFEIKDFGKYHSLYAQSDTLLLADIFEKFRNMCLNEYRLDPANSLTAAGLAWQACLK